MKFKNIWLLLLMSVFAFQACEDDKDPKYNGQATSAQILNTLQEQYTFKKEIAEETFEVFRFAEADFGYPASITYTLEADIAGEEFKQPVEVATSIGVDSMLVTVAQINKAVNTLRKEYKLNNEFEKVELRIKANISTFVEAVYSTIVSTEVNVYEDLPENIYMIGKAFGDWNWKNPGVVNMTPVNDEAGRFWAIRYIKAGSPFKWNKIEDWDGGDFNSLTVNSGFSVVDGNATVDKDGLYMIYIDMASAKQEIRIEPATIYGIGDIFGGWDSAKYPFEIKDSVAVITAPNAGNLRMYAGLTNGSDWWRREFNVFSGVIKYRGNGGDQDPVSVTAGQVVTLDFNAGTGTIK